MKLTKKTLIGMGLVTTVVALTLLSGSPLLAAPPDKDVTVVNTPANPVPVIGTVTTTGTSTVSGTVSAAQSGPWAVGIDPNNNLVSLAPGVSFFYNTDYLGISASATIDLGPFDLSDVSKLRIIARAFNNNGGPINFKVLAWGLSQSLPQYSLTLSEFSLDEATTSLVYELPPPSVIVRLTNGAGGGANYHVVLIGR
jgi:hypothetical protein